MLQILVNIKVKLSGDFEICFKIYTYFKEHLQGSVSDENASNDKVE